jgi:hypothetical protein
VQKIQFVMLHHGQRPFRLMGSVRPRTQQLRVVARQPSCARCLIISTCPFRVLERCAAGQIALDQSLCSLVVRNDAPEMEDPRYVAVLVRDFCLANHLLLWGSLRS